jgi:hypothetical protein
MYIFKLDTNLQILRCHREYISSPSKDLPNKRPAYLSDQNTDVLRLQNTTTFFYFR